MFKRTKGAMTPPKPRSKTPVRSTSTPTKRTPTYTDLPTQASTKATMTGKSTPVRSTGTPTRQTPSRPQASASARPGATRVQGTGNGPSRGSGLKPGRMARMNRKTGARKKNGKLNFFQPRPR